MSVTLGRTGVWASQFRMADQGEVRESAAELEELGFGTLWLPGGIGGDVFGDADRLLGATKKAVVATGVLNLWMHPADDVAVSHARLTSTYPDRFLLGIGVSHGPLLAAHTSHVYKQPLATMSAFLDELDQGDPPVPREERVLAALGPKMLDLARVRSAGAHPYLVTSEHTHFARQRLGPGSLLAPEQKVVLDTDPTSARALARQTLAIYMGLPNYTRNLKRFGFADEDFADGGSDRLADAVVAWGDAATVAGRLVEHLEAGADHICAQVLTSDFNALPRSQWRELAEALRSRVSSL